MKRDLLLKLRKMSEKEVFDAIYRDSLTGVLNRRAFNQEKFNTVAILDLDSLKFINDTLGYKSGDRHLCHFSSVIVNTFGEDNVYRLGGDEFAVTHSDRLVLNKLLGECRKEFPGFSFGIGFDTASADGGLKDDKFKRELTGLRAKRGVKPNWLTD